MNVISSRLAAKPGLFEIKRRERVEFPVLDTLPTDTVRFSGKVKNPVLVKPGFHKGLLAATGITPSQPVAASVIAKLLRETAIALKQGTPQKQIVSGWAKRPVAQPLTEPMMLGQRFADALDYTMTLHARQARKGSQIPYVSHLFSVASIALEHGATEEEAMAALLHDAIEDQGGEPIRQEIKQRFGDAVVAIVNGCTDADVTPKPPWRPRKETYIAHVATTTPSVRLISASDKLDNSQDIVADYQVVGEDLWERFEGGKKVGTLWYYRALVDAFRKAGDHPALINKLDATVTALENRVSA